MIHHAPLHNARSAQHHIMLCPTTHITCWTPLFLLPSPPGPPQTYFRSRTLRTLILIRFFTHTSPKCLHLRPVSLLRLYCWPASVLLRHRGTLSTVPEPETAIQNICFYSISSQCQSTLLTIAGSPEADCLNLGGLLPVITAGANSSLVQPINSWLSATCAQDACSNQTLSDVVANLTSGCSSDLSSLGLDSSDEGSVVSLVQQVYPIVREVACLKMCVRLDRN